MTTKYYPVNVMKNGNADSINDYIGYANENDLEQELFQSGYIKDESDDWVADPQRVPPLQPERVRIVAKENEST